MADVPVYRGKFGERQADRLLWRAGFGPKPGEAAKLARRFNLRGAVRSLTRPKAGERLRGPGARRRRRPADRALRRLRPRPALVARPDGAHQPPAGRADGADLARLVRDRRRRQPAALDRSRRSCSSAVAARLVPRPAARRHRRPGDADLALGDREHEAVAERELRPRADGAVHARRLGRLRLSVFRGRRPRAGAGADRLDAPTGSTTSATPTSTSTPTPPRRRHEDDLRPDRRLRLDRLLPPLRRATPRTRPSSSTSSGATSSRRRPRSGPARRSSASTSSAATRSARSSRRSSCTRPSTGGRRWSSRRSSTSPGCCAPAARGVSGDWSWIADIAGQRLFRPPNVSGWNEARWLDTSTFRGRWIAANEIAGYDAVDDERPTTPARAPRPRSSRRCGSGATRASAQATRKGLERYAAAVAGRRRPTSGSRAPTALCARTRLRMLIATSPDLQTC